jgi:hypothetical protein
VYIFCYASPILSWNNEEQFTARNYALSLALAGSDEHITRRAMRAFLPVAFFCLKRSRLLCVRPFSIYVKRERQEDRDFLRALPKADKPSTCIER